MYFGLVLPEGWDLFFGKTDIFADISNSTDLLQEPTEVAPWQNNELNSHIAADRHHTIKSSNTTCSWNQFVLLVWGEHQQHGEDLIGALQGWNKVNVDASLHWSVGRTYGRLGCLCLEKWHLQRKRSKNKRQNCEQKTLREPNTCSLLHVWFEWCLE